MLFPYIHINYILIVTSLCLSVPCNWYCVGYNTNISPVFLMILNEFCQIKVLCHTKVCQPFFSPLCLSVLAINTGKTVASGERLAKAYDVTIQRYRKSHTKVKVNKMHNFGVWVYFLWNFKGTVSNCAHVWTHAPLNVHIKRCQKCDELRYPKVMTSCVLVRRVPGVSVLSTPWSRYYHFTSCDANIEKKTWH